MEWYYVVLLIWWAAISLVTAAVTIKDKRAAIKGKYRVPEATLMLLGLLGGAAAELAVMKIIRHKTKHKKFMIGLPAEIILHIALAAAIFFLTHR